MSYQRTAISVYGVKLTYEEALRVLQLAGDIGFYQEYQNDFQSLADEFEALDPYDMKMYYDDLKLGIPAQYHYKTFETLVDFFDYFGFPKYQARPEHRLRIPTVKDERRGIQYHRLRYYTDLFCEEADSRGDSLRALPDHATIYGVYIASDGYAYHDDFRAFSSDPRIEANFRIYCVPVLEKLNLVRPPERDIVYQTW